MGADDFNPKKYWSIVNNEKSNPIRGIHVRKKPSVKRYKNNVPIPAPNKAGDLRRFMLYKNRKLYDTASHSYVSAIFLIDALRLGWKIEILECRILTKKDAYHRVIEKNRIVRDITSMMLLKILYPFFYEKYADRQDDLIQLILDPKPLAGNPTLV